MNYTLYFNSISTLPLIETETRFKLDPKVHIQGLSDKGVSEDFDLKGFRTLWLICTPLN